MKIGYFSPSYNRPIKSITQSIYPNVKIVVSESESEAYLENENDIIVCPDSAQGSVCRVRNWILDNYLSDFDCVIILDDDCSGIYRWSNQRKIKLEQDAFEEFCETHSQLAKDSGVYFWGMNCVPDKGAYREHTPFTFLGFIGGPFCGHLKGSQVRYDESLPLKEDYDITLQHIHKYKRVFRVNYAFYVAKQSKQSGGCATYRTLEKEKEQFGLLQKKWGSKIITSDPQSKRSFDYNPILKMPIKGV